MNSTMGLLASNTTDNDMIMNHHPGRPPYEESRILTGCFPRFPPAGFGGFHQNKNNNNKESSNEDDRNHQPSKTVKRPTRSLRLQQQHQRIIGPHAYHTFQDVEQAGPAMEPWKFPPPKIQTVERAFLHDENAVILAYDPNKQILEHCSQVLFGGQDRCGQSVAYWPRRELQKAIYGTVMVGLVLRKLSSPLIVPSPFINKSSNNYDSNKNDCPPLFVVVEWEITPKYVAMKKLNRSMIQQMHGRHAEDPLQEIAAIQHIQRQSQQSEDLENFNRPYHHHQQQLGEFSDQSHIVQSEAVLQDDHYLYCIMPYCCHGDLYGIVYNYVVARAEGRAVCDSFGFNSSSNNNGVENSDQHRAMPEPVARYCFRQILTGLHTLQQNGICHRDLSLENILMDANFNCQIIDFGMCLRVPHNYNKNNPEIMRRLITPQVICGKHKYMSPEVKAHRDSMDGFAVDLWSAGVILYVLLTGIHPYDQPDMTDQRYQAIAQGLLLDQLHLWGIDYLSLEVEDLLMQMLQPDPRDRLTLAQVMEHPWVTEGAAHPPNISFQASASINF